MKHIFYIILATILLTSCGDNNDDSPTQNQTPYEVTLTATTNQVEVDEIVELLATTNSSFKTLSVSKDGGATFPISQTTTFNNPINLYVDFSTPGDKHVVLRATNNEGQTTESSVFITVIKGNAVKLESLQLNTFHNMGGTWDSEFPTSNPNHLADPFFVIFKKVIDLYNGSPVGRKIIFRSDTRMNETNLNWNVSNEELYVNLQYNDMYISFVEDDLNGFIQELMIMPPKERLIPLNTISNTQPTTATFQETDIDLEYQVNLNW